MKKLTFDSRKELRDYSLGRDDVCESDVQAKYRILTDKFADASDTAKMNFCFFDIEVDFNLEDGKGYPTPANPYGEINSIQCWDNHRNRYTMFIPIELEHIVSLNDEEHQVYVVWTHSERDMLQKFAEFLKPIDLLTAWFGDGFDIPYIMARSIELFGEDRALRMYCRDNFQASSREFIDDFGENRIKWNFVGRKHVDLMEVFKKFIPGERASVSLDAVCTEFLGMQKVQYEDEGDLGRLYRENPQKFFEYGLHDARLLKKLDEKLKLIDMVKMMAISSSVFFDDVTGSVKPIEQGFIKFCRSKGNIVLPNKADNEKQKFDGGIVYHTLSGLHKWVFGVDLQSLYPKTMIMLGLSPETMIMQLMNGYEDFIHVMSNNDTFGEIEVTCTRTGETTSILPSKLRENIVEHGFTISANGTIFDGTLGLLAEYAQDGFNRRLKFKSMMQQCEADGDEEKAVIFDLKQKVAKIFINSIYGATGNEYFRCFDIRIAKSVTITAQMISKQQARVSNETIELLEGIV